MFCKEGSVIFACVMTIFFFFFFFCMCVFRLYFRVFSNVKKKRKGRLGDIFFLSSVFF